jgi:hypothetical protein
LSLLQKCIKSLTDGKTKPDEIIVIDNASTDGSKDWLTQQDHITPYFLPDNQGGSYAFTYGMEKALELEADWVWTMDEDVEIEADCLSNMLALSHEHINVDYWCPEVLSPDFDVNENSLPEFNEHGGLTTATFIGTFIKSTAIKQFGLPISNMFRFYDDIEYYWRIGSQGAEGRPARGCSLNHLSTGKKESEYFKDLLTDKWSLLYFRNQYFYLGQRHGKSHLFKKLVRDINWSVKFKNSRIKSTYVLAKALFQALNFKPQYGTT